MKKWILLGIAVLVLLYVLKGFREGFQPEFLDNSQVAKTAQSKNSSYAQVTNNMVPPQGPARPSGPQILMPPANRPYMLPEAEPVAVVDRNLPNAETVGKEKKRARVGKNSRFPAPPLVPAPKFIYVRQETEEIFTPLCLPLPTLDNLIKAISDKYQVSIFQKRLCFVNLRHGFLKLLPSLSIIYATGGT